MTAESHISVKYGVHDAFSDMRENGSIGWPMTAGPWLLDVGQPRIGGLSLATLYLKGCSIPRPRECHGKASVGKWFLQ
jgi:hypothetical protein